MPSPNEIWNPALPPQQLNVPPAENFDTDTMRGSIQELLADNIGNYVVCEFLMGTGHMLVRKQGTIYTVGRSYLVLYEELYNHYVLCDIFSIKFVTFYQPGQRPPTNEYRR